jgi:alpha/beta superfamily hydrolase
MVMVVIMADAAGPSRGNVERITFEAEDGVVLEGEIRLPDGAARAPSVICHPHPEFGGSKDHPLLWAIRNELASRGFVVLSFNFRGVMGSSGRHGGGVEELKDVRAAIGRARQEVDGNVFVSGWSFGAHTALREALGDDRVAALALIGLPLAETRTSVPDLPGRDQLRAFDRPVLLVAGEADPFCPVPELRGLSRRLPRATLAIVSGTDHFFWKREREVARMVADFADESMN